VSNTRGNIIDPATEFVGGDESRSIISTEAAYVSNLDIADNCVGIRPEEYDSTGSLCYYEDAAVVEVGGICWSTGGSTSGLTRGPRRAL